MNVSQIEEPDAILPQSLTENIFGQSKNHHYVLPIQTKVHHRNHVNLANVSRESLELTNSVD